MERHGAGSLCIKICNHDRLQYPIRVELQGLYVRGHELLAQVASGLLPRHTAAHYESFGGIVNSYVYEGKFGEFRDENNLIWNWRKETMYDKD